MQEDKISEVGIDEEEQLFVKPETQKFPFIYRESMQVSWDSKNRCLYSPRPIDWSYVDWFKQIIKASKAQGFTLRISEETVWNNIPDNLRTRMLNEAENNVCE